MQTDNEIEVIQDIQELDLYYVCYKDEFDQDNERTILSQGPTKEIALEAACNEIMKRLNFSLSKLKGMLTCLSKEYILKDGFYPTPCYIDREITTESGFVIEKFGALIFDEEDGIWYRNYR